MASKSDANRTPRVQRSSSSSAISSPQLARFDGKTLQTLAMPSQASSQFTATSRTSTEVLRTSQNLLDTPPTTSTASGLYLREPERLKPGQRGVRRNRGILQSCMEQVGGVTEGGDLNRWAVGRSEIRNWGNWSVKKVILLRFGDRRRDRHGRRRRRRLGQRLAGSD